MRLINFINFIDQRLARLEGCVLCLLLLLMIVLAFVQVVSRNIFSTGIIWAEALVRILVLWVGMFGAILATQQGRHLSIDVLTKFFGARAKKVVGIFIKLFAAIVCLYLLDAAAGFIKIEREAGSIFLGSIPYWSVEIIIPVTFVLIPFHFFVAFINDIDSLSRKQRLA